MSLINLRLMENFQTMLERWFVSQGAEKMDVNWIFYFRWASFEWLNEFLLNSRIKWIKTIEAVAHTHARTHATHPCTHAHNARRLRALAQCLSSTLHILHKSGKQLTVFCVISAPPYYTPPSLFVSVNYIELKGKSGTFSILISNAPGALITQNTVFMKSSLNSMSQS